MSYDSKMDTVPTEETVLETTLLLQQEVDNSGLNTVKSSGRHTRLVKYLCAAFRISRFFCILPMWAASIAGIAPKENAASCPLRQPGLLPVWFNLRASPVITKLQLVFSVH